MTAFLWVDTREQAVADAAEKSITSWIWAASKDELNSKTPLDYDAVYLKAGIIELEQEFARIMRENRPKWLC